MILLVKKNKRSHYNTKILILNETALQQLYESLKGKTWDSVYDSSDPDPAYDTLSHEIAVSSRHTIPEKPVVLSATDQNSWVTKGILKSIEHKNKLYTRHIENPMTQKQKYTIYINKHTYYMKEQK